MSYVEELNIVINQWSMVTLQNKNSNMRSTGTKLMTNDK